jgi:hemerythrin-like domain-containing protein
MISPSQLFAGPQHATLDQPLEHLMACHRRIEQRLETLERAAAVLATRREEALAAIESAIAFLDESGVRHTQDEEQSVFPRLQSKAAPDELAFVEHLQTDHSEADRIFGCLKQAFRRMREQAPPYSISSKADRPGEAESDFRRYASELGALYRRHIAEEDEVLVAIGRQRLSNSDLEAISSEMRERRGLDTRPTES